MVDFEINKHGENHTCLISGKQVDFYLLSQTEALEKLEFLNFCSSLDSKYIARFLKAERKRRTIIVRNMARYLVAEKTKTSWRDWEICVDPSQTRKLIYGEGEEYFVSFSHSPNWYAVAVAKFSVGIDIEEVKIGRPWMQMVDFLTLDEVDQKPKTQLEFLNVWTQHEASIKATGADVKRMPLSIQHTSPDANTICCVAITEV